MPPTATTDLYILPSVFPKAFANDLPAGEGALLATTQRPIAFGAFGELSTAPAWLAIPSWYEVGTIDKVIPSGAVLAAGHHVRVVLWYGPDGDSPHSLDWLDFTDFDAAVRIPRAGPPAVHPHPAGGLACRSRGAASRRGACRRGRIGLTPLVERYWYRWTPADGCRSARAGWSSGRLRQGGLPDRLARHRPGLNRRPRPGGSAEARPSRHSP